MTKVQNSGQILNFWVESKTAKTILVGSDLMPEFEIQVESFADYLHQTEKIGEWYCEIIGESIMVTMQDFWQEEENRINEFLDEYVKLEYLAFNEPLAPLPASDLYEGAEVGQRPDYEVESVLKNIW
jgi:hypothetical protein